MTALHSDLSANLGCRRNISIHAHPPMSVHIEEIRDIRALCWCPGAIVSLLYFSLHIVHKQLQRIRPIWDVLQCDFCMLVKMSGMNVNWGEAPHVLDTSLDPSVRMYARPSSRRGCSQVLFLGILSPHIYSIGLRLRRGVVRRAWPRHGIQLVHVVSVKRSVLLKYGLCLTRALNFPNEKGTGFLKFP